MQTAGAPGGFGQVADCRVLKAEVMSGITGISDPAQVLERALMLAERQRGQAQVPLPARQRIAV
jgi:hypothetical protein